MMHHVLVICFSELRTLTYIAIQDSWKLLSDVPHISKLVKKNKKKMVTHVPKLVK
jgi:hypothetical protein